MDSCRWLLLPAFERLLGTASNIRTKQKVQLPAAARSRQTRPTRTLAALRASSSCARELLGRMTVREGTAVQGPLQVRGCIYISCRGVPSSARRGSAAAVGSASERLETTYRSRLSRGGQCRTLVPCLCDCADVQDSCCTWSLPVGGCVFKVCPPACSLKGTRCTLPCRVTHAVTVVLAWWELLQQRLCWDMPLAEGVFPKGRPDKRLTAQQDQLPATSMCMPPLFLADTSDTQALGAHR